MCRPGEGGLSCLHGKLSSVGVAPETSRLVFGGLVARRNCMAAKCHSYMIAGLHSQPQQHGIDIHGHGSPVPSPHYCGIH